ncbi:RNA polymerase sigma factor [Heyndrickxia vini]|uniref:RNA polymerase sigma factor n=1 Tax=Heyndrickxia vini TaxID=1476025 RepID=A0ABX7E7M8_9BACI|nr:RNA polymerase sigma factor [Heyndrickxia vini]QQZ11234.1 RNA polymerase sigma factor [Heyndrickxia vini]
MGGYSIEELFQKYEQDITSYLIYYTGSADVEDLVQDTFLIAMRNLSNFRENSHPKTWLISIARNIVIDKFRRRILWRKIKNILSTEQNTLDTVEMEIIKKQENNQLYKAIYKLPTQYREVVILRGIMELSAKEASDIVKCSPNKVNVLYHRSLKKLREILKKEGYTYGGNQRYKGKSKKSS